MRLCHHETAAPDGFNRPVCAFVGRCFRYDHDVGCRHFALQVLDGPRHCAVDVGYHRQWMPVQERQHANQAGDVQPMPKPQQFVARTVRLGLVELVGVRHHQRLDAVGFPNVFSKPFCRTGDGVGLLQDKVVERQMKVHVAEVCDDLAPSMLRPHHIGRILVDGLGEDNNVRVRVVNLGPEFAGGDCCAIAIARHRSIAVVAEGDFHAENASPRPTPVPFVKPRRSRASMIAANRPPP